MHKFPVQEGMEILHETDDLLILFQEGEHDHASMVSFTGVGHGTAGIDVQRPEFTKGRFVGHQFYVFDKNRSWGNHLDVPGAAAIIREKAGPGAISTIGNSMGGFLAVLFSGHLEAEENVIFAPQWSVHQRIMRMERRWMNYRRNIREWLYPTLSGHFSETSKYHLIFGADRGEVYHAASFPEMENVELLLIEGAGHQVGRFLKERDALYDLIDHCMKGGLAANLLSEREIDFKKISDF